MVERVRFAPPLYSSLSTSDEIWTSSYHIISYNIVSRRGGMDQYQNMVTQCKAAGVGVIADVVINHMSGYDGPGDGVGGTHWGEYSFLSGREPKLMDCVGK